MLSNSLGTKSQAKSKEFYIPPTKLSFLSMVVVIGFPITLRRVRYEPEDESPPWPLDEEYDVA